MKDNKSFEVQGHLPSLNHFGGGEQRAFVKEASWEYGIDIGGRRWRSADTNTDNARWQCVAKGCPLPSPAFLTHTHTLLSVEILGL